MDADSKSSTFARIESADFLFTLPNRIERRRLSLS